MVVFHADDVFSPDHRFLSEHLSTL
jgi:hypothetical protein